MDYFRQQSTFSHLPNFGILFEKNLYLPNSTDVPMYPILGAWHVDWDKTTHKNVLLGLVQQDPDGNIYFLITACYQVAQNTIHDYSQAALVPKHIFANYWPTQYTYDPLLSVVQLFMADFYVNVAPTPTPAPAAHVAIEEAECFQVCKTEKPDVYHVYLKGQHVSSCLIPNIKISKFMYDFFEHKNLHQLVAMKNLTRHEKSGKYIPYI